MPRSSAYSLPLWAALDRLAKGIALSSFVRFAIDVMRQALRFGRLGLNLQQANRIRS